MLKSAVPGIMTGLLVAVAISVGVTAPLLYTAGWNDANPTHHLTNNQIGFLTYPVWSFFDSPVRGLQVLSYDAALLLLVFVLLIIIAGRGRSRKTGPPSARTGWSLAPGTAVTRHFAGRSR